MRLLTLLVFLSLCSPFAGHAQVDVIMNHNDFQRTGWNKNETILTTENVSRTSFGNIFSRIVDDQIFAQPLVLSNLELANGIHNIVIVATVNNSIYAFDADDPAKSSPYWKVNLTYDSANYRPVKNTDMTGACTFLPNGYSDFTGNIGIVGTPTVDRITNTLFVVARSKSKTGSDYVQYLHAIDLVTGSEKNGSPVLITASYEGNGSGNIDGTIVFDSQKQNQRAGLLFLNGVVYICWASHCGWGPYHGWMLGYDATTLQRKYVYNTTPNGESAGIWMSGQPPSVDDDGNIIITSGNGTTGYNGNPNDTINRASSLIKLTPKLKVLDFFTPSNYDYLNSADRDYGINGALIIPGTQLSLSGSKDGGLYLVDNNNMGGTRSDSTDVLQRLNFGEYGTVNTKHLYGSPVYFKDNFDNEYIYGWAQGTALKQIPFDRNQMLFDTLNSKIGQTNLSTGYMPGAMLSVSSNGSKSGTGILWASHVAGGNANHNVVPGVLQAFDASDVTLELWNSDWNNSRDSIGKFAKFVPPTIANGKVYMATFSNKLNVYGLIAPDTTQCTNTGSGLLAEYFSSTPPTEDFPSTADVTTTTPTINFDWQSGSPEGISEDLFKARFSGTVQSLDSGRYTFYVKSEDGIRLWINNQLLIDNWNDKTFATEDSASIFLQKCKKNYIKLEFYKKEGNGVCILKWEGPNISKQVIPSIHLYPADTIKCFPNGTGLYAEYFSQVPPLSPFPLTPTFSKVEPNINFNWGMGSPQGISVDHFKARYTGQIMAVESGEYNFYVSSDDGYRLWVNNQLILDKWFNKSASEDSIKMTLSKCFTYNIKLEYFENGYTAVCILKWSGPGITKQVITSEYLYPIFPTSDDSAKCKGTGTGILAQYFSNSRSNEAFPATPTVTKTEPTINFNWGMGSPENISSDLFKVRFIGQLQTLDSGKYTFYITSDDGYRLWVDNQLLVDKWIDKSASEDTVTISLSECKKYNIKLEYYENIYNAICILQWSGPGFVKQVIPTTQLYPDFVPVVDTGKCANTGTGLITEYFSNSRITEPFPDSPTVTKIEPDINFNWGMGSPTQISVDHFKARFKGQVKTPDSGKYTFYITSDDGYRLWVDDQLLMDKWINKSASEDSVSIILSACTKYNIKLEYFENGYSAVCILKWSGPGTVKQIIPTKNLYPEYNPPVDTSSCISNGTGLLAEYFSFSRKAQPFPDTATVTKIEPTIYFNWGMGGPPDISIDHFKARFSGQIQSLDSGKYTFYISSDDGYRLWLNNQLLADNWVDKSATEDSVTITLSSCTKYDIKLEYYENGYTAVCIMQWSGPGFVKQVIPSIQLYPKDSMVNYKMRNLSSDINKTENSGISKKSDKSSPNSHGESGFKIYPNPNNTNSLTISMEQNFTSETEVSIYNIYGQRVMTTSLSKKDLNNNTITLPINFASGIYLIKVTGLDKIYTTKFIVL